MNDVYAGREKMPVIGTDSRAKGKVVLYHNGCAAGYSSSVHLIPEDRHSSRCTV